jgi:transposase
MARYGRLLTDAQWEKIRPLLPRPRSRRRGGRPRASDRKVLEGILWMLRSGARWQDLPEEFPSPATCWRRLRDWEEQGVWLKIWRAFLAELNERKQLQWSESFLDGSFAPAKKGALEVEKPSGAGRCGATASAGKSSAPSRGSVTSAIWWFVMTARSRFTAHSFISPAS